MMGEGNLVLAENGRARVPIVVMQDFGRVGQFAVQELARYLERISKARFSVERRSGAPPKPSLLVEVSTPETLPSDTRSPSVAKGVCESLAPDSFSILADNTGVCISAGTERGLLYGIYDFLEQVGCRFLMPGEENEFIPIQPTLLAPSGRVTAEPSFQVRSFIEDSKHVPRDNPYWLEVHLREDLDFIDWIAKRKANRFFIHRSEPNEVVQQLLIEMKKRGIERESGGHILSDLLPRELFTEHPEFFRANEKGQRVPDGNLCPSNRKAVEVVCKAALERVLKEETTFFHVWGADLMSGGWCYCPECRNLTPQDQYLIVCQEVYKELRRAGLDIKVDYLAYHDTLTPNLSLKVEEPIVLLYAPRERCYAHPLDDASCETNAFYLQALRGLLEKFSEAYVFEYYADAFLYGSMMVPLSEVITLDLRCYHRLGIEQMMCLMFGAFSWWAYPLNLYLFAQLCWDVHADVENLLEEYFKHRYGKSYEGMRIFYKTVEQAMSDVVFCADPKVVKVKEGGKKEKEALERRERHEAAYGLIGFASFVPLQQARQLTRSSEQLETIINADQSIAAFTIAELEALCTRLLAEQFYLRWEATGDSVQKQRALWNYRKAESSMQRNLGLLASVTDRVKGTWGGVGLIDHQNRLIEQLRRRQEQLSSA